MALTLARALLRAARGAAEAGGRLGPLPGGSGLPGARAGGCVAVRAPPDAAGWGKTRHIPRALAAQCRHREALRALLPWLAAAAGARPVAPEGVVLPKGARSGLGPGAEAAPEPGCLASGVFSGPELAHLIADRFRRHAAATAPETDVLLDQALDALRVLLQQRQILEGTSVAATRGVLVEASSARLEEAGAPMGGAGPPGGLGGGGAAGGGGRGACTYVYRIRLENLSDDTVQLVSRGWVIRDSGGDVVAEVPRGTSGVVGHTPILRPGDCFEYSSGTQLPPGGGVMEGSFQMEVMGSHAGEAAAAFDARVAPFALLPA